MALVGRAVRRSTLRPTPQAPPAHWGPEFWPAEVRENVKSWPPVFRERELLSAIRTPLNKTDGLSELARWAAGVSGKAQKTGSRRIALVSNKDGVGKSTTALILQTIFNTHRDDWTAVLDANVDAVPARRMAAKGDIDGIIESLGAAPIIGAAPGDTDYREMLEFMSEAFPIVLCDVGSGIGEKATRQILDRCDEIVVVATPQVDGLYAASSCIDDLRSAGYTRLADNAICAINRVRPMPFSDLVNIDRHFQRRVRKTIRIAWDSRATRANAGQLDELRPTTRTGFFELAAAVARTFGHPASSSTPREEEEEENC